MHDEVSHFGVVDGTLRFRFPRSIGAGVVRIDTDDVEPVEVAKLHARYAFQLTTEDEMEQLLCWLLRHLDPIGVFASFPLFPHRKRVRSVARMYFVAW